MGTPPGGQPPEGGGGQPPSGAGGQPPPAGGPTPGGQVPTATATLWVRIGARLLDVLIIGIPLSIVLALFGFGAFGGFGIEGWISGVVYSLLWFGYFVWLESSQGATLGKKLLNLRVVQADGTHPTPEQAAKRNIWMLLGLIPLVGGLLSLAAVIIIIVTISSNPDNRGYHDTFAGTAVMR